MYRSEMRLARVTDAAMVEGPEGNGPVRAGACLPEAAAAGKSKPRGEHTKGLLVVGLYKLSKAIFFSVLGLGALDLIHKNFGQMVMQVLNRLPIDPESHLVSIIMDKADLVGGHQLRQAGLFSFLYAGLCLVEGFGLVTQQVWAEYFTVVLTAAALPWEGYEIVKHYELYKVGVMGINLGVLLYLLWVLKKKKVGVNGGGVHAE